MVIMVLIILFPSLFLISFLTVPILTIAPCFKEQHFGAGGAEWRAFFTFWGGRFWA